jgi:hypothetical protein
LRCRFLLAELRPWTLQARRRRGLEMERKKNRRSTARWSRPSDGFDSDSSAHLARRRLLARQPRPHLSHEPSSRSPAVLHPRIFTDSLRGPNDSVYTRLLDRLPASSTLACSSSPSAHQRHRRRQKHQTRLLQFWVHAPNQITAVLSSRLAWLK